MYAVIDIGSNTMRLSAYSIHDREIKPMFSRKNMSALISYVDEKRLHDKSGNQESHICFAGF